LLFPEKLRAPPQSEKARQVNRSLAEIEFLLRKVGFEALARRPMFALMNYPVDSTRGCAGSAGGRWCWQWRLGTRFGAVLGAVLYPLELALVARLKEGPSTELMLCRRLPDP
jgi:hypothetical protein